MNDTRIRILRSALTSQELRNTLHEQTLPKKHGAKHGARMATATQMLRSNRDDAFLGKNSAKYSRKRFFIANIIAVTDSAEFLAGDTSPLTKPGNLVKFAGDAAASDLNGFYDGLKKSRYGANNGHLRDVTPKGEYKSVTASKAQQEINGYFAAASPKMAAHPAATAHAKRALDDHTAASDVDGYFDSLNKGKHGANNGHLKDTTSHASAAAKQASNKKLSAQESRDQLNQYYGTMHGGLPKPSGATKTANKKLTAQESREEINKYYGGSKLAKAKVSD
jgi:hypothetical protein